MSDEITVTPDSVVDAVNSQENEQMLQLKKQVHEAIDQADGILIFAFKKTEVELQNGQKALIPKSMFKGAGASGCGDINLAYCATKVQALLAQENEARNTQQSAISE